MSYKIIDLPALGRQFNATDIIEVSADGTGSYKANIGDFTLGGENYIFVNANGTPAQNGAAVKTAYTAAIAMTPNGVAKSATNRVVILLAPGYYTFNEAVDNQFLVDQSFIDFESLSGEIDVYFSSIEVRSPFPGIDVRLSGIDTTKNNYYSHAAFAVSTSGDPGENIIIKNCVGGDYSFSSYSSAFYGVYENCTANNHSFGSTGLGFVPPLGIYGIGGAFSFSNYGTIKNCTASQYSFCTSGVPMGGTTSNQGMIDSCTASQYSFCYASSNNRVNNTGTIKDCQSLSSRSFCVVTGGVSTDSAVNSGTISNCISGNSSFCFNGGVYNVTTQAANYGNIINCFANGNFSFCSSNSLTTPGASLGENWGLISNCNSYNGANCFVGNLGSNTGIITDCIADQRSFCCDNPASINWDIYRCTMISDTFTVGATGGGRVVLGIDTTGVVNF